MDELTQAEADLLIMMSKHLSLKLLIRDATGHSMAGRV
jgi:hypothetical protein